MARIGIVFGLLLFGLTVTGLSLTVQKTYTLFIPMMFGIPMLFLGVVALNPHRRRESVNAALILMLVGMVLGGGRLISLMISWYFGGHVNSLSFQLVTGMTIVCAVYVIVAERWRRGRRRDDAKRAELTATLRESTFEGANPDPSDSVTRVRTDNDNPYQPPVILTDPTPASTRQPTDRSSK